MIAQFIPFTAHLVWLFFGFIFIVGCLLAWCFLASLRKFAFAKLLRISGVVPGLAVLVGLFSVWLCWPNLHDYSDVTAIAKPGVDISAVIKTFGQPSEYCVKPNGSKTFLYAEGIVTGFTCIETDPKGMIVNVGYVD